MHLSPGEIRAYQDQELPEAQRQRAAEHLASCPRCQTAAQEILSQVQNTGKLLSRLHPESQPEQRSIYPARQQLAARLARIEKENNSMSKNIFSRISRPAWVVITLTLVLAVALAFPGVRAAAVSFLGMFRVEQIQVVEIDPDRLPGGLDSSSNLEKIFSEDVQVDEIGQPQEVPSAAEAGKMAGMVVRLPEDLDLLPAFYFQPGGSMTFNVDLELVKAVLKDLEREDIELPKELDNAVVQVTVNASVVTMYGDCRYEEPSAATPAQDPDDPTSWEKPIEEKECINLIQMPSPTVSAPPELNLGQIGEAYLQILGFSREEAVSFARNIDWTTTFVIPIPRYHGDYREVTVDGVKGVLLNSYGSANLTWVKDGVIYFLYGTGTAEELLAIANSLQ